MTIHDEQTHCDKGDESEQAISNKSGQWLRQQIAEQCVPTVDTSTQSSAIAGRFAEPTKSTIVTMVYDAATYMDEHLVPENGRVLFVRAKDYPKIILSDEWHGLDSLAGKQLPTGTVGQIAGFTVVKVPSNMFPTDVYMVAAQESALAFPYRINDTKIHQDPPGISGALIEGRQTYDLFVLSSQSGRRCRLSARWQQQACTVAIVSKDPGGRAAARPLFVRR